MVYHPTSSVSSSKRSLRFTRIRGIRGIRCSSAVTEKTALGQRSEATISASGQSCCTRKLMTWEKWRWGSHHWYPIDHIMIILWYIMYIMNPNHIINNFINIHKQYPVTIIYLAGEIGKETEGTAMAVSGIHSRQTEELQNQCRGRERDLRDLTLFAGRNCKCLESP